MQPESGKVINLNDFRRQRHQAEKQTLLTDQVKQFCLMVMLDLAVISVIVYFVSTPTFGTAAVRVFLFPVLGVSGFIYWLVSALKKIKCVGENCSDDDDGDDGGGGEGQPHPRPSSKDQVIGRIPRLSA